MFRGPQDMVMEFLIPLAPTKASCHMMELEQPLSGFD
jgi:hypothetical protein